MTPKLYTCVFNYMEGTFVSQVRVDDVADVIDAWLDGLKCQKVHSSVAEDMTVLDYFESCVENKKGFEQQIREDLNPEIGEGERLTELDGTPGAYCACFLLDLFDVEHSEECTGEDDTDCQGCADLARHLCELYVVETAS